MRQRILKVIILSLAPAVSNAALLGRAPIPPGGTDYQAYYDTELNLTWDADTLLARTTGYSTNGLLNWNEAQTWIGSLNGAGYLGVSDWRLPSANSDGTPIDCSRTNEPNCPGNEMGYMFWKNGVTWHTPSPFTNLQATHYWFGTEPALGSRDGWVFHFERGNQNLSNRNIGYFAWAVRPSPCLPPPPGGYSARHLACSAG